MDQFRALFAKLDQDKDGFISVSELHSEMKKHGIISVNDKAQVTFFMFVSVFVALYVPGSYLIHSCRN